MVVVAIEHLQEQAVLVAEGVVQAGPVDTHGVDQILNRRGLESLLDEHARCGVQHFCLVKLPRSAHDFGSYPQYWNARSSIVAAIHQMLAVVHSC